MKKFKTLLSVALLSLVVVGCNTPSGEEPLPVNEKELALESAIIPYIDNTVVPTYRGMADNALLLAEACAEIQSAHADGTLSEALIIEAGEYWKESRRYWEESEAFLYGAAADYNIDPHIDSWPLDKNAMDDLLADINAGKEWSIDNNINYGLLGFHAVEYMLFELSADGTESLPHNTNYTAAELIYLVAVADDLAAQCVRLEASWAGMDGVSATKRELLEEAELEPSINYGESMKTAGQGGSLYKTYQEAAEELVDGCVTIADEVANTKMGTPVKGAQGDAEGDRNYIESPYSLNSIVDFQGNIISIKNAYSGSNPTDASVADYIKSVNAELDSRVMTLIDESFDYIGRIPEPFAQHLSDKEATDAIDKVNELVAALEEVYAELSKH
ncbi:MAG: hypothetical protein II985_00780 [Alistipes sp.]|nr:hypothetical protein [Alistipes sp.]